MKQIFLKINLLTCLLLLVLTNSCREQVLDVVPVTALSDATAFSSAETARLAVLGMYNKAQGFVYFTAPGAAGANRGYPFGAAHIQQGDMRGEDMINQALFYAITNESTYSPVTANNLSMWNTLFALINETNIIIEGVRGALTAEIIPAALAQEYEAEARFLRALAYHELLIHFARPFADGNGDKLGVPYRTFAVTSGATADEAAKLGRNTVAECYTLLLEDLDFAELNAPPTRTGDDRVGRVTSGAAIALKTRIKLHQGDWNGVITEANKIVSAAAPFTSTIGGYALTASPDGAFTNNASTESIFSLINSTIDNPGANGALAAMAGAPGLGGRGLIRISPIAYRLDRWLLTDKRRTLLTTADTRSIYTTKFRDYVGRADWSPIIRYPEVLLNLAEAIARTSGVDARAIALLNAVRDRALENPATETYTAADFATANDLIGAILDEVRIEFLGEGRRWSNIHRLAVDPVFSTGGIPAKMSFADATRARYDAGALPTSIPAISYDNPRFIWPIPADELANNPAMQPNPGY